MTDQILKQAIVTADVPYDASRHSEKLALFQEDGQAISIVPSGSSIDPIVLDPVQWVWFAWGYGNVNSPGVPISGSYTYMPGPGDLGVGATITSNNNETLATHVGAGNHYDYESGKLNGGGLGTNDLVVGQRIMFLDGYQDYYQGIYTITDLGSESTPWILTRATDLDSDAKVQRHWVCMQDQPSIGGRRGSSTIFTMDNYDPWNDTPTVDGTEPYASMISLSRNGGKAFGYASMSNEYGFAAGQFALAFRYSTAIGYGAQARDDNQAGEGATAIGNKAVADNRNSSAFGHHSLTIIDNETVIGSTQAPARLVNPQGVVDRYTTQIQYNSPNLTNGVVIYTPNVGDVLVDVWLEITEAWDGTTPKADVGTFVGSSSGLWAWLDGAGYSVSVAHSEPAGTGLGISQGLSLSTASGVIESNAVPSIFTATNPLKVVVSQDGEAGGASPASTQGAMTVHVFVSRALHEAPPS